MSRHISNERKVAYYLGAGLMILGGILFASTFVTFAMRFMERNFNAESSDGLIRGFCGSQPIESESPWF